MCMYVGVRTTVLQFTSRLMTSLSMHETRFRLLLSCRGLTTNFSILFALFVSCIPIGKAVPSWRRPKVRVVWFVFVNERYATRYQGGHWIDPHASAFKMYMFTGYRMAYRAFDHTHTIL